MPAPADGSTMAAMDPRRDGLYRLIRLVFLADMVGGLLLAALAGWVWNAPPVALAGGLLAATGLLLFLFFGRLARRAAARGASRDGR